MSAIATINMSHEDWIETRKNGIGGSDVAAVLGISKYKSPIALWLEKTGMVEPEDLSEKESVYWGNTLEEVVAKEFERRTGKKVKRRNAILFHPKHSYMFANVDRLVVGEKAGLECKTAGWRQESRWEGDEVPDEYYLQCQHYLAVTGLKKWYIAVLIGGQIFVWKEIPRNEEIIRMLIEKEADFWSLVETRTRPAIDGSEASAEALKRELPSSNGSTIDLPADAAFWIEQYETGKESLKTAEEAVRLAENHLKEFLGENEAGECGERVVIWKSTKPRESFDKAKFEKDYPGIYQNYTKPGAPSRRFSVK
ncbi:lambda-exonuclease family protein [uncultured Anaeromusa sp.]|uniref:YqaJ viral recombinase family nuclease n=1 Tax=uncultured Anaeromusa sp. TaxID=673273 RepID=UPI0029C86648|nr:YqaJ viral recombinase family protein [uncultured Anaeromusa sp.]